MEDAKRWAEKYHQRMSILKIAKEEGVDPGTVSSWLHRLGVQVYQGLHRVQQPPLKYPQQLLDLTMHGPDAVMKYLDSRVWGLRATDAGLEQLDKFCKFVQLHQHGVGVVEAAEKLSIHRSTAAEWREGTDQPYLVRAAIEAPQNQRKGWKALPLHLSSGGNEQGPWIQIPMAIHSYSDITSVVQQIQPLPETYALAQSYGVSRNQLEAMRPELLAYALGMMLGDAGKGGGIQERFTSTNIDLQFSSKEPSNESLGEFVCMCFNSLGIGTARLKDKPPSGDTLDAAYPTPAYRWRSDRSPLIAWLTAVGMGLAERELTSTHCVNMDWIFQTPNNFRKRFAQALADSDGTVKPYVVIITSTPNADFTTRLLRSLGISSAHTLIEDGKPLRTSMKVGDAMRLPIFNEFVKGYRYRDLEWFARR